MSVLAVSIIGSLVSMLSPEGEGGGMIKNVKLVLGICVALVCIYPIKELVNDISALDIGSIVELPEQESDKYGDIFESSYSSAEAENLKSGIKQLLSDKFGIDSLECSVSVRLSDKNGERRELESISVTLYGSAIFKNTDEIERCLESIFNCEIITVIG